MRLNRSAKAVLSAWGGGFGREAVAELNGKGLPEAVRVYEVGPRDGLQNEKDFIPTEKKIRLVDMLGRTGLTKIETTAFVHPKLVPQMADASKIISSVASREGVDHSVLVPNAKGLDRALEAAATRGTKIQEIAIFTSASEEFNEKNLNRSIKESLQGFSPIMDIAKRENILVRGYVSVAVGCPYSGYVDPRTSARIAKHLYDIGCYEISMGDTIGIATPNQVVSMIRSCVAAGVPVNKLALHAHDTRSMALANVYASLQEGVTVIDAAIGGLGGCPFAATSSNGNLATEDLLYMLHGLGISTGIDMDSILECSNYIQNELGLVNHSRVARQELMRK
jgi:hydroxymethylglutaryl-CoA lyase